LKKLENKMTAVTDIWKDVFGKENTNPDDNFFDLGGDSIMALKMMELLRRKGYTISLMDVFDDPTLEGITEAVVPLENEDKKIGLTGEQKKAYPITNQQKWFFRNIRTGRNEWCEYVILSPKNEKFPSPDEAAEFLFKSRLFCNYNMIFKEDEAYFEMSDKKPAVISLDVQELTPENCERAMYDNISIKDGRTCCIVYDKSGNVALIIHHLFVDAISMQNIIGILDAYDSEADYSDMLYAAYAWEKHKEEKSSSTDMKIFEEDSSAEYLSEEKTVISKEPIYNKITQISHEWGVTVECVLLSVMREACADILLSPIIELERIGRDLSGKWNRTCGWISYSRNINLSEINGEQCREIARIFHEFFSQPVKDDEDTVLNKAPSSLSWNYIGNMDSAMEFRSCNITAFGQFSGKKSGRFSPAYCAVYFKDGKFVCSINYDVLQYSGEKIEKLQREILSVLEKLVSGFELKKDEELNSIYEILGGIDFEDN
jgi:aryl carrier-like protein